ncbi:hypothetical protein [Arthrobacter sp. Leaf141]|uniref:hypothetical protein n=1 Tax=Arthrobacter sp. Leaf141 TaxID=1736273 RepID=UPI0009EBFA21
MTLHDHLDGGLRPEMIVELAAEAGVQLPFADGERLADWPSWIAVSVTALCLVVVVTEQPRWRALTKRR